MFCDPGIGGNFPARSNGRAVGSIECAVCSVEFAIGSSEFGTCVISVDSQGFILPFSRVA